MKRMKKILLAVLFGLFSGAALAAETVEVWKTATCGCCGKWIEHLQAAGFQVRFRNVDDLDAARSRNGVPRALGSCHTARVGGYALEGHVPAADVRRLLRERPKAAGLAVPGMPSDAPGMDGRRGAPYEVLLFDSSGGARVYSRYGR